MIAYFADDSGSDTDALEAALADRVVCLPPVVLTEVLSDPNIPAPLVRFLLDLPVLATEEDFWGRAGNLRRRVLAAGKRARLADTLIAQSCLDHETPLITRDRDFLAFERLSALKLVSSK